MFKKVAILCFMVMMLVSCARQASDQISQQSVGGGTPGSFPTSSEYSVLWQNYGSDEGNTNVVYGRLPAQSASLNEAASEAGLSVFSSPIIFQDSSTNDQSVIALWAKSDQLKVVRYTIGSSTLTQDSGFTPIELVPNSATYAHQAHQIALSIQNDQPFIFVAHNGGVSKFNALTGAHDKTVNTFGSVYRLLVSGTSLYIQSGSHVAKLHVDDMENAGSFKFPDKSELTRQLPLVISENNLYVVHDKKVYQFDTDNLNALDIEQVTGHVAGLMAYDKTLLYSDVRSVDLEDTITSGYPSRTITQTDFKWFSQDDDDMKYTKYLTERNFVLSNNNIVNNIGDHSFTAFADTLHNLYLPGHSLAYSDLVMGGNVAEGVVKVDKFSPEESSVPFYNKSAQEVFSVEISGTLVSNNYVPRFVIYDSVSEELMSVLNVNELLFKDTDTFNNSLDQKSSHQKISTEPSGNAFGMFVDSQDKGRLDNYNSRIILGIDNNFTEKIINNDTVAIQAVSVGNQAVVFAGSDSKLYLLSSN